MRPTAAIAPGSQTDVSPNLEKPILSRQWSASNGEHNTWEFHVDGDKVVWRYSALFDRDPEKYSHGDALFYKNDFRKCLCDLCVGDVESGRVQGIDHAEVIFWSNGNGGFLMRVHDPRGDSLLWSLEPLTRKEFQQALQALE